MRRRTIKTLGALVVSVGMSAVAAACSHSSPGVNESPPGGLGAVGDGGASEAGMAVQPFQPDPPAVYVAKVKNLLTGLAPTALEMNAVVADAGALPGLIDTWMATPEYQTKMLRFFELAFQQTQVNTTDFTMLVPNPGGLGGTPQMDYLVENIQESLGRTALAQAAAGEPLTDAFTTHSFMMTPALKELYAFLDQNEVNDTEGLVDAFATGPDRDAGIAVESAAGPIPFAGTIDPSSLDFMHWYFPSLAKSTAVTDPSCTTDPRVYPASAFIVFNLLYGRIANTRNSSKVNCGGANAAASSFMTDADFTTWSMVTVRPPTAGEATTSFYDLDALRKANELVMRTPRVGFFTTPAFEANWQTNTSNQMRVTTNQSLIVATGAQIDGTDPTIPPSTPGLDAAHAAPGSACYTCHQTLDPTRSILQATYSYGYGLQTTPALTAQPGLFAFQGVVKDVKTIDDFATALATHPLVATAWVQKLCYYANSVGCAADDPEFQRLVALWKASHLSWNVLVKALMASPITTNASVTATATERSEVASVSRRDHLCALLNARLGFADICGQNAMIAPALPPVASIAAGFPSDSYGRGSTTPLLPIEATLFYRAGTENACEAISTLVVDPASPASAASTTFTGADPTTAIASFVSDLMGLTASDPRAPAAATVLANHFQDAVKSGSTATDALRSTFVLACNAPSVIGMGM